VNRRSMKAVLASGITALLVAAGAAVAGADRDGGNVRAKLKGFEEVPSVSTVASGKFKAKIDRSEQRIDYKLSFEDLEANSLFAHIHLGQRAANGGVSVFLCGGGDKPPCPATAGTVEGTIDPADVIGPANQGIAPGEFDELVRAIRAGVTYANVHSSKFPGGEIRGQIRGGGDD
jgi:CHRD domain